MFLELDKLDELKIAAVDDLGTEVSYGQLCEFAEEFGRVISERTVIICLCDNSLGSLLGYVACEINRIVPILLGKSMDSQLLSLLIERYRPSHIWLPETCCFNYNMNVIFRKYGFCLLKTGYETYEVNDKLSLLLTTSGTTGSPKLVRYKYGNLEANAFNVSRGFGLNESERPIVDLPMHYTMSLNVINTYLVVGATLVLTNHNIMKSDFWNVLREKHVTSFTGVPFSYELFSRLKFERMELPYLKTLFQGGGKLTDKRFLELSEYAFRTGRNFFATFGTTETSARMSFLPAEMAMLKCGSIGKAFPGGEMFIIDERGMELSSNAAEGELCYRGPNVTMGYAHCIEDLMLDDIWNGEYHTGDIARRDEERFYYISGRLSRILKLSGHRVSLDQCENLIKSRFSTECACTGTDSRMKIFITEKSIVGEVLKYISEKTNIYRAMFEVTSVSDLPKNEAGKILYKNLE